jgi:hypothetical protein
VCPTELNLPAEIAPTNQPVKDNYKVNLVNISQQQQQAAQEVTMF